METFSRVFPLDWVAIRNVVIVLALVAAAFAALAVLLRYLGNRRERWQRALAEQIAVQITGEMMASRRRDGDRFALKESNSVKRMVREAVLALSAGSHADPLAPFYRNVGAGTSHRTTLDLVRDQGDVLAGNPGVTKYVLEGLVGGAYGMGALGAMGYGSGSGSEPFRYRDMAAGDNRATLATCSSVTDLTIQTSES